MEQQSDPSIPQIDISRPSVARMYDYYLGGKDNYRVDREAVERVAEAMPEIRQLAQENRAFLRRAVRYMARQAHGRALLASDDNTSVATADMHSPDDVLQHAETTKLIDFDQPVGILMIAMTHFLTVDERPSVMGRLRDALAPGSHLTVTHVTTDGKEPEAVAQIEAVYATTPTPIYFRDRATIEEFFDGFELVEPGLVTPDNWRPDPDDPAPEATKWLYAGVGRKP
jgi:hypothetical protein